MVRNISEDKLINDIQKNRINNNEENAIEWLKCRNNPLYFVLNYVYLPEIGGKMKYSDNHLHHKLRRVIRSIFKHHKCILMATRQLGKSSIAACLITHAVIFFPGIRVIIINMRKDKMCSLYE